jgi:DNA-binding transcriptional MerR regulator
LDQRFYQTGEFARRATVSVRTLRFYDKAGLLSPSGYTEAGYRLYTDSDFFRLQQILALKFLGFSLGEIKRYLHVGPIALQESLALQKLMMQEKREQLDTIIQALDETEKLLTGNSGDWDAIVKVIQVMQMQQSNDWVKKYFTDEQLQKMEELSKSSYTEEQRAQIAEWGKNWSEEDQQVANRQWGEIFAELKRLVAVGADPTSAEAQALVRKQQQLIGQFTHGDAGILEGLKKYYKNFGELATAKKPFPSPYTKEEAEFLQKALEVYEEQE